MIEKVDLLLINPPSHIRNGSGSFFPLGLGYIISSAVANGSSWHLIDCTKMISSFFDDELIKLESQLLKELQNYSPILIGIGPCITSQFRALKIISDCCKKIFPTAPVIAGGPLPSIDGQEWLFFNYLGLDRIVKGDGEFALAEAITAIKVTGNLDNCEKLSKPGYSFLNEIKDINSIRFPYRDISYSDTFSTRRTVFQPQAAMITSRGCRYSCNYCVSGNLKRIAKVRKRSVNNIIQEMEELHRSRGVKDIIFYDDCFFDNPQTAFADVTQFCDELLRKEMDITWQIELRSDVLLALSIDSIRLLENSGCRQINLGIEKTTAEGLKFLGKSNTFGGLKEKNHLIKNVTSIRLAGTFILGGGNETRDDVVKLVEESKQLGLDFAQYNPLFIYPGTPLYKRVFESDQAWIDYLSADDLPWGEIVYENSYLKRDDLLDLVDYAYLNFYENSDFANEKMITDRFNIKSWRLPT